MINVYPALKAVSTVLMQLAHNAKQDTIWLVPLVLYVLAPSVDAINALLQVCVSNAILCIIFLRVLLVLFVQLQLLVVLIVQQIAHAQLVMEDII